MVNESGRQIGPVGMGLKEKLSLMKVCNQNHFKLLSVYLLISLNRDL